MRRKTYLCLFKGWLRTAFILCDPVTLKAFTGTPQTLIKKNPKHRERNNTDQCF